jgi:hypothetical protein
MAHRRHGHDTIRSILQGFILFPRRAMAIIKLAVILVSPSFYDLWNICRQMAICLPETATGIGAPLLADIVSSNSTASEMIKTAGMQRVPDGETNASQPGEALQGEKKDDGPVQRRWQLGRMGRLFDIPAERSMADTLYVRLCGIP